MSQNTIYWYDFETFGIDPRRNRVSQFAGIRTDENLNIIGDPLMMYCKPANDFLPDPVACVVTGISPQQALKEGLPEVEFIDRIHAEFSQANTCVAGYNSIRFDDEMTRQLLYRNFYDPYEREWKNGNSRWDIIDMVRLCAATRPEGINWPKKDNGNISFRLDQLSVANGIEHEDAHDALADVIATIELAKLVKQKQAKLFDYVYGLRSKKAVQRQLDMSSRKPVLHISMMYPAAQGCLTLVMPVCQHPINSNAVIVYDLREDPRRWQDLSAEQIRKRIFLPKDELSEEMRRIPLKTIQVNQCPVIASPAVLNDEQAMQFGIDIESCREHWGLFQSNGSLLGKVLEAFNESPVQQEKDPDFMIYSGGFFSDQDRDLMTTIRSVKAPDLGRLDLPFKDGRLNEMLFRYRARNYPDLLSNEEKGRWEEFRLARVNDEAARRHYQASLLEAKERAGEDGGVLVELEQYVQQLSDRVV